MSLESLTFTALGSTCELFAIDAPRSRLGEGADWVRAMHARLTRFDPTSELSRLNTRAGEWVAVSEVLESLLREALRAYEASGGLVHAGVLAAMRSIGYTRDLSLGPTAPSGSAAPLAPLPRMLEVRPGRARLAPGSGVDLGGIAKGWLADRLAIRLGPNALANLGGDLFARGPGTTGEGWPVGMGAETLLLRDAGAATSGTWRRRFADGRHHLIDPRTGTSAETDVREASIVAASATEAETLAKAALLLGSQRAPAFLAGRALRWRLN